MREQLDAYLSAGQGQLTTGLRHSQLKKHVKMVEMQSTPDLQVFETALTMKCRHNIWGFQRPSMTTKMMESDIHKRWRRECTYNTSKERSTKMRTSYKKGHTCCLKLSNKVCCSKTD